MRGCSPSCDLQLVLNQGVLVLPFPSTQSCSPLVLQDGSQVTGLVPRGCAGVDDVGAGSRAEEEGGEAAGLGENDTREGEQTP